MTRRLDSWARRLALWLVRLRFDPRDADEALDDLAELDAHRRRTSHWARAGLYYWAQVGRYLLLGMTTSVSDSLTGQRGGRPAIDAFLSDAASAVRAVRRRPWFQLLAGSILALAIGATAAAFSVVQSVLLDRLPVAEPDQLVAVWKREVATGRRTRMTPGNFSDISALTGVFASQAAFSGVSATLVDAGEPVVLRGGRVTAGYLDTLGVRPALGRGFRPGEDRQGEPAVVLISDRLWRTRFGEDPAIVGRDLTLDGTSFEVIGVLPPGVYPTSASIAAEVEVSADAQDVIVPLRFAPALWTNRRPHILGTIARLRPGVTIEQADSALSSLATRLHAEDPDLVSERFEVRPFSDEIVGGVRAGVWLLAAAVGLVLLVAVANVGALVALRAADRRAEFQVRAALGAPRHRLVRQVAIESVITTGVGCGGAVAVAVVALGLVKRLSPFQVPRLSDASIDWRVFVMTAAIGLLCALAFGGASGLGATRRMRSPEPAGRSVTGRRHRLHRAVVSMQAALAVVVLVGASLMVRSFLLLRDVPPGFSATHAWMVPLNTTGTGAQALVDEVRGVPGVAAAAVAYDHPLERTWEDGFRLDREDPLTAPGSLAAAIRPVGDEYFDATGIAVVVGRAIEATDSATGRAVAVVNEAFVDRYLGDGPAVGRRVQVPSGRRLFGDAVPEWFEIVGVVASVRALGPDREPDPALYLPLAQFPGSIRRLIVRPAQPDADLLTAIGAAARRVAPDLALEGARRLDDLLAAQVAAPRFSSMLLTSFGAVGLLLTGLGLYGLVSRSVASRRREIGIRIALGARPARVLAGIVSRVLAPALAGTLAGLACGAAVGQLLQSMLFGVNGADPATFIIVPAIVAAAAILACVAPARRAIRLDPVTVLRDE
jgi:predicted permease